MIRFFVDRPVSSFMVYAIFSLIGILALFRMPVDLMPGGDAGVLTIFVGIRGGLPPEDIESLVTKIVEDEMSTLPHLDNIVSVSRKERAVVTLNFKSGTDTSRAALEVQERLAKIRGKLPKEIEKPVVSRYDESQSPILILAMSSKHYTPEQMREIADNQLKPVLKRANGVANIEIGGGREKKILVELDKNRLEAYALPIRQVVGQIGSDNLNILTGKMETARDSYYVRTVGAYRTIEDIGNLPIAVTKEGSRIRLKDVAEIRDFYMEAESYSRLNREPVVSAYIQKETLANTITTAKEIKKVIEDFRKDLDPRITTQIVTDQSVAVEKALNNLLSSLYQGAFLVGSILLFFLKDFISTSFICLSIPLSLVLTLAFMNMFGLSLNVMTISGLAIASGQVVDTSICVLESIMSHKDRLLRFINRWDRKKDLQKDHPVPELYESFVKIGKSGELIVDEKLGNKSLAITGSDEMFLVLVANTLTCIVVFLPIVFLNPQVKIMYLGLAITVTAALLVSLLIAVTIIPSLSANISRKWVQQSSFFSTYFWLLTGNKIKRFNLWFNRWIYKSQSWIRKYRKKGVDQDIVYSSNMQKSMFKKGSGMKLYRRIVAWMMRKRYWVALGTTVALIGSGIMYKFLDKEFVGTSEENEFIIFVELPSGAKLDVSDKIVSDVEKVLNQTPEVQKSVKTSIARVEGWSSKIYVTLLPREERTRTTQDVMNELRPLVQGIGKEYDAFIYFSEPVSSKEFVIDVFGYDYNRLRDLAVKIAQSLEKVEGLADTKLRYKPGRPEVKIEIDREKASLFDFTVHDIAESLHAQIRGLRATYLITPTAQIETVARLQEQYRKTLEDVQNLTLVNNKGNVVSVRQFSIFTFGLTPSEIWRKDRERMIQVSANRGDISLSKVAEKSLQALRAVQLPTGYYYEIGGDFPKMIETEKESRFAFIIMVILVYSILAALFESYAQPLIILLAVPLSMIGAIPLLLISHTPVTLGTLIGFIMLGGIAVNNSTILVEVFNNLHEDKNILRALLQSGQERISPIMATTLTNISGMLPLVFQSSDSGSLWAPMAITVIGGLITSTILILFILPGFYLIMEDSKDWLVKMLQKVYKKLEKSFTKTTILKSEV